MKIKSLIIVAVLAIAILGFGLAASAQTTDVQALIAQLQAQIASLMAQLKALQAQQGTTTAWCHTFNNNLKVGDGGMDGGARLANDIDKDVSALKQALYKQGLYDLNVDQPGTAGSSMKETYFNEQLASSVVAFQEKYSSEVLAPYGLKHGTGFVGSTTRIKLNKLFGCSQTIKPTCTSITFSDWSSCFASGARYRTITSALPIGCDTSDVVLSGPCTPTTQSSATITSSSQTNSLMPTISGTATGTSQVGLKIAASSGDGVYGSGLIPVTNGKWSVTVSPALTIGQYTIYVYGDNNNQLTSSSLTIVSTTNNSISSPKSGDIWEVGKTYNVIWNPSVFQDKVSVALINKDNNKVCDFDGIANTGTYMFTVPTQTGFGSCDDGTNISGSRYQIQVWTKAATLYSQVFSVSNPSGWQTYTNSSVGYTIQYPSQYTPTTSNCYLYSGQNQVNDANSILIGDTDNRLVHICYFTGVAQDFFSNFGDNNYVSTTFNGYPAYKDTFNMPYNSGRTKYIIQRDASHVLFIDETWAGTLKDTTDKIVSTLILTQ